MSTGSSTQVARRGVFPRLRDARIRAKLALILFVPLVAVVALAGVSLVEVSQRASQAGKVEQLTRLGADVSQITQLLQDERILAASYLAAGGAKPLDAYTAATRATDAEIKVYFADRKALDGPPGTVVSSLGRIDNQLTTIGATRNKIIARSGIAVAEAVSRYGVMLTDLVAYGDVVSQYAGDGQVADGLRALSSFAKAKLGTSEQDAIAYAAALTGDSSQEEHTAFIATETSQQEALLAFSAAATTAQQNLVDTTVTGDAVNLADGIGTQLSRGQAVDPASVAASFGAVVDLMRFAESQLEAKIIHQATEDKSSVVREAAIEAVLVLLVLAVAIALAVVLARSLNLSLRRLREGALSVANRDLPDAVARLRDSRTIGEAGVDEIVRELRDPIRLSNRDEVGQVAQAFNVVHREAVRIAAEQAALRTSVSTMFLNLARRSQSLVDRMIGELDLIERTEEDPKRLARLFELDHLATRMRRNDENLLVLAGADSSAPRREDALLVDALRAAQSEVELYNRIEFGTVDTDVAIAALAVNDVVRLVAELLDNATRFSPPTTTVVAEGRRIRDYVVIQVEDRGLGMSEDQMNQLNHRLAEPPSVDVGAFRLMGLAVVGRLASRYGIRVELRANLEGGTIAQVTLPAAIVVLQSRRTETPRSGRSPELNGPTAAWDTLSGRTGMATATLPTMAPEPWREPDRSAHPQLPMFPSQRPLSAPPAPAAAPPAAEPTPDRPPLPTRVARPITAGGSMNGFTPTVAPVSSAGPAAPPPVTSPASVAPAPAAPPAPVEAPASTASLDARGWGAALAAMPPAPVPPAPSTAETRSESPIFVQMQQSWFRNHEGASQEEWGMPTAGYAPPPNSSAPKRSAAPAAPPAAPPAVVPPPPPQVAPEPAPAPVSPPAAAAPAPADAVRNGSVPRPRPAAEDRWRTAADEGWQRANAASAPKDAGTTRSGLPKRVPQAQLVPGGVQNGPRPQSRRTPDEVRGLLSAYHRGVQRGRTDGTAEISSASQVKEREQ